MLTYVGAYEDRQVVAAVRRELLREGQVFYIHNRVQSIEKAAARIQRAGARGAGRHRARPDGGAPARAGDARLLGEALRRAGLHDDRRVRPRRLQRQHDDHRALRHPRPLPAAPAARPGRPLPRARLRLLPLPAGEAAHRDRPRAAGHAGPALRPRRRHGDRDEGPRDPRRRQPARRRAVRPHRRRRLRPLRPAGRRGGAASSGRTAPAPRSCSEVRIELPVDAHLPHDYIPSERLRLEMYKRLAEVRSDDDVDAAPRGAASTATASRRRRWPRCSLVARFRGPRPRRPGSPRSRSQGKYVRFAPVDLPDSRVVRLNRLLPEEHRQGRRCVRCWCRARSPGRIGGSLRATRSCWRGPGR